MSAPGNRPKNETAEIMLCECHIGMFWEPENKSRNSIRHRAAGALWNLIMQYPAIPRTTPLSMEAHAWAHFLLKYVNVNSTTLTFRSKETKSLPPQILDEGHGVLLLFCIEGSKRRSCLPIPMLPPDTGRWGGYKSWWNWKPMTCMRLT